MNPQQTSNVDVGNSKIPYVYSVCVIVRTFVVYVTSTYNLVLSKIQRGLIWPLQKAKFVVVRSDPVQHVKTSEICQYYCSHIAPKTYIIHNDNNENKSFINSIKDALQCFSFVNDSLID